jgi:hypothetical protein
VDVAVGESWKDRLPRQPENGAGSRGRRQDVILGPSGGDDPFGEKQRLSPEEFFPVPESSSGNEQTVHENPPGMDDELHFRSL